jgi:hypothetical protein
VTHGRSQFRLSVFSIMPMMEVSVGLNILIFALAKTLLVLE